MNHLMSDTHASVTATLWSGGDWCDMVALGSDGTIPRDTHGLLKEIAHALAEAEGPARQALEDLAHYVGVTGPRPPVAGWAQLWDADFAERIR